ncbi:4-hydroxyproline epimerase [Simiduia agarivorans]|uniref:Hydroxyproline-2-epimerase n=1 Tax=Simiduia agarivorans (strain DSM 21679 / JCM 13881 / BCRC 17597 / SA1) TaxID=1117647 RepID=K4KVJ4_SIMAS|nr:4-hydroxyproline epimerase [Simiduia agarivorans]AFU97972.1 hydroxyproline-2-epimerase [Simiduia agarivorans SA1 = DSM 21679]
MKRGTFFCIDAHTCGNPVRLVTSGHPVLRGRTMGEKRLDFMDRFDWIRQALMFEPRGHDMMSGAFLYPPVNADADCAILFIETSGCLPMCGHGTIGALTAGLEAGLIQPRVPGELTVDVPAGQLRVSYRQEGQKVLSVKLTNVPSFLYAEGLVAEIEGLGSIVFDVAYGGNFYAIVEPQPNFPGVEHWSADQVLRFSPRLRAAGQKLMDFVHPEDAGIRGLSHVLWTGAPKTPGSDSANAVFYGDKAIDRSPCGTGTSARMAQRFSKGLLSVGDRFVHESFIGSQFTGRVEAVTEVAGRTAIIPSIEGWAKVYGANQITVDDEDPYAFGFQVI